MPSYCIPAQDHPEVALFLSKVAASVEPTHVPLTAAAARMVLDAIGCYYMPLSPGVIVADLRPHELTPHKVGDHLIYDVSCAAVLHLIPDEALQ